MRRRFLVLLIALAMVAVSWVVADCPGVLWCDFHTTYAGYRGNEYPMGKCYCIYEHTIYNPDGSSDIHRLATPCSQSE